MTSESSVAGHTPGPWHLVTVPDAGPDGMTYWYVVAEEGARAGMEFPNAETVVDPECGILTEADSNLVAAAPELLEALMNTMSLLKAFSTPDDQAMQVTLSCARAAIAKATGGARHD